MDQKRSHLKVVKSALNKTIAVAGLEIQRSSFPQRDLSVSSKVDLSDRFKNYHLGCGALIAEDFLNIDGDMKKFTKKIGVPILIQGSKNSYGLAHDLRNGIPAANSSLQTIYHSHFLEHLTNEEGASFLRDCYQCLAGGGTMRFALPDFELWCRNYVSTKSEFFDWYRNAYLGEWWWQTHEQNAMVFSGMLFNWGHKMVYDFSSLSARLAEIGFVDITRMAWGISTRLQSLDVLESVDSDRRIESLVVECRKPPST